MRNSFCFYEYASHQFACSNQRALAHIFPSTRFFWNDVHVFLWNDVWIYCTAGWLSAPAHQSTRAPRPAKCTRPNRSETIPFKYYTTFIPHTLTHFLHLLPNHNFIGRSKNKIIHSNWLTRLSSVVEFFGSCRLLWSPDVRTFKRLGFDHELFVLAGIDFCFDYAAPQKKTNLLTVHRHCNYAIRSVCWIIICSVLMCSTVHDVVKSNETVVICWWFVGNFSRRLSDWC